LKAGVENLSGYSLDDVKVHYNSAKPAQLQAHAYAQGTDIHVAPGQEKHLPHEAWHVVQQKQGRVKPTMQMKGRVNVNNDENLEKEADAMGGKALQFVGDKAILSIQRVAENTGAPLPVIQRMTSAALLEIIREIFVSEEQLVKQAATGQGIKEGQFMIKLLAGKLPHKELDSKDQVIAKLKEIASFEPSFADSSVKESPEHLDVPQGMAIVGESDVKSGLKTRGVGPCVAVGLASKKEGRYALAHFDSTTVVKSSLGSMVVALGGVDEAWVAGGTGNDGELLFDSIVKELKDVFKVKLNLEYCSNKAKGGAIDLAMVPAKEKMTFSLMTLDKTIDRVEEARKTVKAKPFSLSMEYTSENKLKELDEKITILEEIVGKLEELEISNVGDADEKMVQALEYLDIAIAYLGSGMDTSPAILDRVISLVVNAISELNGVK